MSDLSPFKSRIYVRKRNAGLTPEQRTRVLLWRPARASAAVKETRVLPSGLHVRFLRVSKPRLAGRTLLFFSDTHVRSAGISGFFPGVSQRGGTEWLTKAFHELFATVPMPDCILFGGDLAGEAAWIGQGLADSRPVRISSRSAATGSSAADGFPRNAGAICSRRRDSGCF